jgi:hypothetical protein
VQVADSDIGQVARVTWSQDGGSQSAEWNPQLQPLRAAEAWLSGAAAEPFAAWDG